MTEVSELIESLSQPLSTYIDEHNGNRMIQHTDLSTTEEILLHLINATGETEVDELIDWIPDTESRAVKGSLNRLKQDREVRYDPEKGVASITNLGRERASKLEEEYFGD